MSSAVVHSETHFEKQCKEIGPSAATVAALGLLGVTTSGIVAQTVGTPGQDATNLPHASVGDGACFKRRPFEALTSPLYVMRQAILYPDGIARQELPEAEKSQTLQILKVPIRGCLWTRPDPTSEPGHSLLELACEQESENMLRYIPIHKCVSSQHEILNQQKPNKVLELAQFMKGFSRPRRSCCPWPHSSYERHIEALVRFYPVAWHLIVLADEKARGELARYRPKFSADTTAGNRQPERWDPTRPWISCFHALVADGPFGTSISDLRLGFHTEVGKPLALLPTLSWWSTCLEVWSRWRSTKPSRKSTKERRQAKKRRLQSERGELKAFRVSAGAASGNARADAKQLKEMDEAGNDLCFGWDAVEGPCAAVSPGQLAKARSRAAHVPHLPLA